VAGAVGIDYILIHLLTHMLLFSSHLAMLAINLGLHLSTHAEKEARFIQYGPLLPFNLNKK
jgi:hypothetical protein